MTVPSQDTHTPEGAPTASMGGGRRAWPRWSEEPRSSGLLPRPSGLPGNNCWALKVSQKQEAPEGNTAVILKTGGE